MIGLIRKPWGFEYCAYRSDQLAIWVLELRAGHRTSLHAHPGKNTAFVVIDGEIELQLLRGAPIRMTQLDKLNVFRGRFHRLHATTDAVVLEVEAPDDKRNIVRLEDSYGRTGEPLERPSLPLPGDAVQIMARGDSVSMYALRDCWLCITNQIAAFRGALNTGDVYVSLRGGFANGLFAPGEAIDLESLQRLAKQFQLAKDAQFIHIWRP